MTARVFVRPCEGRFVRDEYTLQPIPPAGAWVKRTRWIERRLAAQDAEECEPPAEEPVEEVSDDEPAEAPAELAAEPSEALTEQASDDAPKKRGKKHAERFGTAEGEG